MLSKAFIDDSKELNTLKLSDLSLCLHSCTKKCTGVSPIAYNRDYSAFRSLTFDPLCRFHVWSDWKEIFSAFEP